MMNQFVVILQPLAGWRMLYIKPEREGDYFLYIGILGE
jgi:hypothetical protein